MGRNLKRIHIIGRKNSGKTTLTVDLVKELTRRGHRVGTIKHTHHHHELDTPGKDSHRHRQAGSSAVGILSPQMNAIFWPNVAAPATDSAKYEQFDSLMSQCDIVLVEGDSATSAPKIEVYRAAVGSEPMATGDPTIQAVVTDDPLELDIACWPRADLSVLVQHIEAQFDRQ